MTYQRLGNVYSDFEVNMISTQGTSHLGDGVKSKSLFLPNRAGRGWSRIVSIAFVRQDCEPWIFFNCHPKITALALLEAWTKVELEVRLTDSGRGHGRQSHGHMQHCGQTLRTQALADR
jgi:hypothetical protein